MSLKILPADQVGVDLIKKLTDEEIGRDYFGLKELDALVTKSVQDRVCASLVLWEAESVVGLRLTYPPGRWSRGKGESMSPHLWPHPFASTAYFQSLFIAKKLQKQGWGTKLSLKSIELLKTMGAKGIVCHSWVESPGDSSGKYLRAMNFKAICQYPKYWNAVDYICPRCGKPCVCTAEEMYLDLEA